MLMLRVPPSGLPPAMDYGVLLNYFSVNQRGELTVLGK